mmetsp:Transcript_6488/g.16110  ORF Transcript_6488/g.16110 Transcript_6488/m.16110 type:complete len:214 (+) Transcript_6488:174-815(+)
MAKPQGWWSSHPRVHPYQMNHGGLIKCSMRAWRQHMFGSPAGVRNSCVHTCRRFRCSIGPSFVSTAITTWPTKWGSGGSTTQQQSCQSCPCNPHSRQRAASCSSPPPSICCQTCKARATTAPWTMRSCHPCLTASQSRATRRPRLTAGSCARAWPPLPHRRTRLRPHAAHPPPPRPLRSSSGCRQTSARAAAAAAAAHLTEGSTWQERGRGLQ